jgi:regulator of sigma E protease
MNLLPFPALDGGRCFLYMIEFITRKSIPQKVETAINNVGFGLLMVLMVFLVFNDITRIIG